MWKQLTFSEIAQYLSRKQDLLTFKGIEHFFAKNEVAITQHPDLLKIHWHTLKTFKWLILGFVVAISFFKLIGPVIIHQLISNLDLLIKGKSSWVGAASWSVVMIASQVIHSFVGQHYIYQLMNLCQSISKKINKMIFAKTLSGTSQISESEIINRSVQDSEIASNYIWTLTEITLSFVTIVLSSVFLFIYLGSSVLLPLVLLFTIFPLGKMYAKRSGRLQSVIQKNKDDRLESLSNYLGDMNAVKAFGWEDAVFKAIKKPRRIEQHFWSKLIKLKALSISNFLGINVLVASLAFGLYILNGGTLSAELAFTCLCYFGFLEPSLKQLSKLLNELAGVTTANGRIQAFLDEKTTKSKVVLDEDILKFQSIAIVGKFGGGKSTLLRELLPVFQEEAIGFQPQEPYIFEASLLENLTFGKIVSKEAINKSLDLTFLNTDLTFSEKGLRTRLQSQGSNLSFAQKQKIVLARSYCLNPQVLLLDEPCSSFDKARVDAIFNNLIFGEWKDKKKIIVTSQIRHLKKFERIVFIDSKRKHHIGTYRELLSNAEFLDFILSDKENNLDSLPQETVRYDFSEIEGSDLDEEIGSEKVSPSLYYYYFHAMHAFKGRKRVFLTMSLLALTAIGVAFLPIYQNVYITKWTDVNGGYLWALGYLGIGAILALLAGVQNYVWSLKSFKAATNLHDSVLSSVLDRYISFFEINPGPRILNVFSKDLDTIEKDLTFYLEDAFMSFLHTASSLIVLLVTLPIVLLILIPLSYLFTKSINVYRNHLCRLKTLIAEARIPRMRSMAESIEGQDVINSFNAQRFFMARMNKDLEQYQNAISFQTVLSRWFVIKLSSLGSVISLSVAAYVCYYCAQGVIGKGIASMMILYSFKFWENFCWSVKSVNEAESQMIFVRKFNELSKANFHPAPIPVMSDKSQDLTFENVIFSAHNDRFNSINLLNEKISGGEKVGVYSLSDVSRSAFLGMMSGSKKIKSGRIHLGELDVNEELNRSSLISFVSDKNDLFRGNVRSNLDPLYRKSEQEMMDVLAFVGLDLSLEQRVMSGGANLSGGERKLMCLARAILADTAILVIDESCPARIDQTYQQAIEKVLALNHKTVLLISDDQDNLKKCQRIFRIDHRINHTALAVAG